MGSLFILLVHDQWKGLAKVLQLFMDRSHELVFLLHLYMAHTSKIA